MQVSVVAEDNALGFRSDDSEGKISQDAVWVMMMIGLNLICQPMSQSKYTAA